MKRLIVPACTFFLLGMMGCAGDPREGHINNLLKVLDNITAELTQVKTKLKSVLDSGKPFQEADLKEAMDAADKLKDEVGKQLLKVQRDIQQQLEKKSLTKEEQEEFKNKYRSRVKEKIAAVNTEQREVDKLLIEANKRNPEAVAPLLRKLKEAQADFEAVAKRT